MKLFYGPSLPTGITLKDVFEPVIASAKSDITSSKTKQTLTQEVLEKASENLRDLAKSCNDREKANAITGVEAFQILETDASITVHIRGNVSHVNGLG